MNYVYKVKISNAWIPFSVIFIVAEFREHWMYEVYETNNEQWTEQPM